MTDRPQPTRGSDRGRAPALVIAGHGTRDAEGQASAARLVELVRRQLPDVLVDAGYIECAPPALDTVLTRVQAAGVPSTVVVPLMIGTGGHVRGDVPEAVKRCVDAHAGATIVYTRHLGPATGLVQAVIERIDQARDGWGASETAVVLVGRGCSVTDANADHVRLTRVVYETGGYERVVPAFIQVASPTVADALEEAFATGARRIVVMPHYLFPGRLSAWVRDQAEAWCRARPEAEVRVADVIGECSALVDTVVKRYREGALRARTDVGSPSYMAGLLLSGRKVVAVGGGCVNRRRVPRLVAAGADVTVVAPDLHPGLRRLVDEQRVTWLRREFVDTDLDGAWYVLAATDDAEVNTTVAAAAETRHTFCVRADAADEGSAWTPATGDFVGGTLAVLADHDPMRSRRLRDQLLAVLEED